MNDLANIFKFYNKINIIYLDYETQGESMRDEINYKFICSIQNHVNTDDYFFLITPSANNDVVDFLNSEKYNYRMLLETSKKETKKLLKYCNGFFVGFDSVVLNEVFCKKILISPNNISLPTKIVDATPYIYGIYFVCCYGNYVNVIKEQLSILIESGLYKKTKTLYIFVCMCNKEHFETLINLLTYFDADKKITLVTTEQNLYEKFAINNYKKYINDDSFHYVYYFHTKAVSRTEPVYVNRRQVLNIYTLAKHELNINLLNYYDAVGCSLSAYPTLHFSGNFWWARSDYLITLKEPIRNTYLAPEMYICSNPKGKFVSLCQTANFAAPVEHINKSKNELINQITTDSIANVNCRGAQW
jgi:hypothetical protein